MLLLFTQFVGHGYQVGRSTHVFASEYGDQQAQRGDEINRHASFFQTRRFVLAWSAMGPGNQQHRRQHGIQAPEGDIGNVWRQQVALYQAIQYFDYDPTRSDIYTNGGNDPPLAQFMENTHPVTPNSIQDFTDRTLSQTAKTATAIGNNPVDEQVCEIQQSYSYKTFSLHEMTKSKHACFLKCLLDD